MNPVLDALWSYYFRHVLPIAPSTRRPSKLSLPNFPQKPSTNLSSLPYVPRTKPISHSWLDNLIVICPEVHIMKHLIQSILRPYLAPSILGKHRLLFLLFCFHDATLLRERGLLIVEASRSHSFTQHIGRTPLDEWSARRRKLYLTTHYTYSGRTSVPPAGFGPVMPTIEQSHTDALVHANTGTRSITIKSLKQTVYCAHRLY
jgi:hypothetical protein